MAATAAESTLRKAVRGLALGSTPARADGRTLTCVRPLRAVVDILPHTHGSAMFERGMTQARAREIRDEIEPVNHPAARNRQLLSTITLGQAPDAQLTRSALDGALPVRQYSELDDSNVSKRAFLHYDFPPYCTNEIGRFGAVNRRMIGHGALAEKAVLPVLPPSRHELRGSRVALSALANACAPRPTYVTRVSFVRQRFSVHSAYSVRGHRVKRVIVNGVGMCGLARSRRCRCAN